LRRSFGNHGESVKEAQMRKGWGFVFAALLVVSAAASAFAEGALAGMRVGDPPRRLLDSPIYGPPDAILSSSGILNPTKPLPVTGVGAPGANGLPAWAFAVRFQGLAANQVEWIYNRDPVAIGFVLTGEGLDAQVTNIAVAYWRQLKSSNLATTAKDIRLGDSFAKVLLRYGFPRSLVVLTISPVAGAPAAPSGPGQGLGPLPPVSAMGPTFAGDRRFAEDEEPGVTPSGARPPAGVAPLQPGMIQPGAPVEYGGQLQVSLAGVQRTFSRHLEIGYTGIDFTIYDMKVVRIHAYG
jgi:hypothetical protein